MKFRFNNKEIYIDGLLAQQLETIIYNIKKDWDFFIILTGDRMVRTGKSVLAMVICSYLAMRLKTPFTVDNIFLDSKELIQTAKTKPKYSVLQYDEARDSLNTFAEKKLQEDLINYFAECGQLNHVVVIVMPDFFELKENIAIARSECLINVYRKSVKIIKTLNGEPTPVVRYDRGQFEFFNRKRKCKLYDIARIKRRKNYNLVPCNFVGSFTNTYPVDENEYREKKLQSLARHETKNKDIGQNPKLIALRNRLILNMNIEGFKQQELCDLLHANYGYKITTRTLRTILKGLEAERSAED